MNGLIKLIVHMAKKNRPPKSGFLSLDWENIRHIYRLFDIYR